MRRFTAGVLFTLVICLGAGYALNAHASQPKENSVEFLKTEYRGLPSEHVAEIQSEVNRFSKENRATVLSVVPQYVCFDVPIGCSTQGVWVTYQGR